MLLSPVLSTLLTVWFFVYLVAIQAVVVGVMEIVIAFRERAMMGKVWPVLLSGVLYVLFGIVLALEPLMGAVFFVVFAGFMMILFAAWLTVRACLAALSRRADRRLTGIPACRSGTSSPPTIDDDRRLRGDHRFCAGRAGASPWMRARPNWREHLPPILVLPG